jgi:hypothetical protein
VPRLRAARYGRDIGEFGYAFDAPDAAMPDQARGELDLAQA